MIGQRRRHDHAARSLGNSLPRVARAHDIQVDAVRPDVLRFRGGQRTERADGRKERVVGLLEDVGRREAGHHVDVGAVGDVRRARADGAELLDLALVDADERLEAVDRRALAAAPP